MALREVQLIVSIYAHLSISEPNKMPESDFLALPEAIYLKKVTFLGIIKIKYSINSNIFTLILAKFNGTLHLLSHITKIPNNCFAYCSRQHRKTTVVPLRRAENGKNSVSYPYENRKTRKIARRRGTIDEKRQKQVFVGVQSMKNRKKKLS